MKTCGNCKWHEREKFTMGWVCVNAKSKRCTDFTMEYDTCSAWEGFSKPKPPEEIMRLFNGALGKG